VIFDDAEKRMIAQKAEIEKLRLELSSATVAAATATNDAQSNLDLILQEEREKAAAERQNLVSQITSLINSTADEQDQRLVKRIKLVQSDMVASKDELEVAAKKYNEGMIQWSGEEDKFINELTSSKETLNTMLANDWEVRIAAFHPIIPISVTVTLMHERLLGCGEAQCIDTSYNSGNSCGNSQTCGRPNARRRYSDASLGRVCHSSSVTE
jgi:hypothetical protein